MRSFIEEIGFNRAKEDNWDIINEAKRRGFECDTSLFAYIGYDVNFEIEVCENGDVKVLKINDIDVSDRGICI